MGLRFPCAGDEVGVEVELQFLFCGDGPLVVPTRLADLELQRSTSMNIVDTYFDSETLELRRSGCSLRVRQADNEIRPFLTLKGPARKRTGAKRRYEAEVEIDELPEQIEDMGALLRELGLAEDLRRVAELEEDVTLAQIGALRNRRSGHAYEHGLHRLELTWDELEFPTGPPEIRLEVEAHSRPAERLLARAADELRSLFGDDLIEPSRGKTRELCQRLYPELLAA
jgi:uncharacterized protein YjbK